MKKHLLIGFLAGILFASAFPVYGAVSSLVGKKVTKEMTVKVDDEMIGTAIVVDGRGYLPIRTMTDALNLELQVDSKEVNIVTESIAKELEIKRAGRANIVTMRDKFVEEYNQALDTREKNKERLETETEILQAMNSENPMRFVQAGVVESADKDVKGIEKRLIEIQTEIDKYNQMLVERDTEIAELEAQLQKK